MTSTGHALIGATIAYQIPNPLVSLPLAFASHYLLDKIPHWDPLTNKNKSLRLTILEESLLLVSGYLLVVLIFLYHFHSPSPLTILAASTLSMSPDWLEFPYVPFKIKLPLSYQNYKFQSWIHHVWFDAKMAAPWGFFPQIGVVLLFLSWVFLFPTR